MLRMSELFDVVDFVRAVGDRPYGHFDHDANRISGPASRSLSSNITLHKKRAGSENCEGNQYINTLYEAYDDPVTGEVLYRAKNRAS